MTLYDRPRHQVLVGDRDVTERCDTITYSATDTGGFEIATLGLPATDRPKKGTPITIRQGLEVAWAGRVAEVADHSQHGRATKTTGCEGWRALMRDATFSMIYADRDLTRWGDASTTRQIGNVAGNFRFGSSQAAPDASGIPAIVQTISDSWVSPNKPVCEAWYDAGADNGIASVWVDVLGPGGSASWSNTVYFSPTDADTLGTNTANLNSLGVETTGYAAGHGVRYALLQFLFSATPAGAAGDMFITSWRNTTVYGPHGIIGRGSNPQGYWPSDIARHALSQCSGIAAGAIVDSTGFIAPHVVYRTATPADQVVDDMAKLMGWPWGVWEPSTIFGSTPRMDFRPPPTDATAVVTKADCDQLDITARLGDLYNVAQITYTDPVKGVGVATVALPNSQLTDAGIAERTLPLDMGPGTLAAATTFGQMALALSQVSARGAGQATLPVSVRLPGGAHKPACLLRPGLDRLRIVDLNDAGSLLDIGTGRRDVFRISRTETAVAKDGSVSTRVELDNGTNLLEVLQARLSTNVGQGASGG